eukprot:m51a1_g13107 hypothetical protein (246) ;mRNA; f:429-2611
MINSVPPVSQSMLDMAKKKKNWRRCEARNFGLLLPYLLENLVSVEVLKLWTLVSMLFSMAYFPRRTLGLAKAMGIVAHKAIKAILKFYRCKDGKAHHQLNLHSLHLDFFVEMISPASLFNAERAENAQARVVGFAQQTSYKMKQYALRSAACFQMLTLCSMIEDHGVDVKGQVLKVHKLRAPDAGSLYQAPFEYSRSEAHEDEAELGFDRVHRCVIMLPRFYDITSEFCVPKKLVIVPTRFLVAP